MPEISIKRHKRKPGGSINLELRIEFGDRPGEVHDAFRKLVAVLEQTMTPQELEEFRKDLMVKVKEAGL